MAPNGVSPELYIVGSKPVLRVTSRLGSFNIWLGHLIDMCSLYNCFLHIKTGQLWLDCTSFWSGCSNHKISPWGLDLSGPWGEGDLGGAKCWLYYLLTLLLLMLSFLPNMCMTKLFLPVQGIFKAGLYFF